MGYLTMRHATPRRNLPSILSGGIDPKYHMCVRPEVWLHSACKTAWAILHTGQRHQVSTGDIAVVTVRVPRQWLVRRRRCVWTVDCRIPPAFIVSVNPRAALAEAGAA